MTEYATDDIGTYTHPCAIESLSDILEIVNRPTEFLSEIIDDENGNPHFSAPLGRNHQQAPRPYPHGLWFRGHSSVRYLPRPSVFRDISGSKTPQFLDERDMFTDIRLRASNIDLRGFDNFELMCLMQHHELPTRLMDWTESPLVACFFATSRQYYDNPGYSEKVWQRDRAIEEGKTQHDPDMVGRECAIYVLNAYRLNALTNLSGAPNSQIFQPSDIDVVLRATMAEHTYLESVREKARAVEYINPDLAALTVNRHLSDYLRLSRGEKTDEHPDKLPRDFLQRLAAPVAVMPRRSHPRMDAQLSCFTIHGGKSFYSDMRGTSDTPYSNWNFLPRPLHLDQMNSKTAYRKNFPNGDKEFKPFMKKFKISKYSVSRIMIELDRLGISESMFFPDMDHQAKFVRRRWAVVGGEKPIWSLPRLARRFDHHRNGTSLDDDVSEQYNISENNYMRLLYGLKEE